MEHYYNTIEGWFDFSDFYGNMVKQFPDGSHFVELGSWKGTSATFMGVEIANSGKNIKFDCVDIFEGDLLQEFTKNIEPIKNYVNIIVGSSHDVYTQFEDESIDFLFIDADHTYEAVKKDLELWHSKVKYGGVIGGHDYTFSAGVKQAVHEFFKNEIEIVGDSWKHNKIYK